MNLEYKQVKDTMNPHYPYGASVTVREGSGFYGVARMQASMEVGSVLANWCADQYEAYTWKCQDQGMCSVVLLFKEPYQFVGFKLRWFGLQLSEYGISLR